MNRLYDCVRLDVAMLIIRLIAYNIAPPVLPSMFFLSSVHFSLVIACTDTPFKCSRGISFTRSKSFGKSSIPMESSTQHHVQPSMMLLTQSLNPESIKQPPSFHTLSKSLFLWHHA